MGKIQVVCRPVFRVALRFRRGLGSCLATRGRRAGGVRGGSGRGGWRGRGSSGLGLGLVHVGRARYGCANGMGLSDDAGGEPPAG